MQYFNLKTRHNRQKRQSKEDGMAHLRCILSEKQNTDA